MFGVTNITQCIFIPCTLLQKNIRLPPMDRNVAPKVLISHACHRFNTLWLVFSNPGFFKIICNNGYHTDVFWTSERIWLPILWRYIAQNYLKKKYFLTYIYSSQNLLPFYLDKGFLIKDVVLKRFLQSKSKSIHLFMVAFLCILNIWGLLWLPGNQ